MTARAVTPMQSVRTLPSPMLETVMQFWYRLRSDERIPTSLER